MRIYKLVTAGRMADIDAGAVARAVPGRVADAGEGA